jgi:hypothetical protein
LARLKIGILADDKVTPLISGILVFRAVGFETLALASAGYRWER